jgi:hypothetical protein
VRLKRFQEPEQFSGEEKVAQVVGAKVVPETVENVFGDGLRGDGIEMPVQQ